MFSRNKYGTKMVAIIGLDENHTLAEESTITIEDLGHVIYDGNSTNDTEDHGRDYSAGIAAMAILLAFSVAAATIKLCNCHNKNKYIEVK